MSDAIEQPPAEETDAARAAVLERMAKARAARGAPKRTVTKRTAPKRTAEPRAAAAPLQALEPEARGREEGPVTRVSRNDRQINNFPVPASGKKPGRDYMYITITVLGEPVTTPPITEFYEGGWRPEKAKDWPTVVAPGTPPDAPVDRLGQRLFSRPMQFTIEARQEDYNAAEQQRRDRMQGAIEGRPTGEQGLAGLRGIRVEPAEIQIEGEIGSRAPQARR